MSSPEAGLRACEIMVDSLKSLSRKEQVASHGEAESTAISAVLLASEAIKAQASKMALLYKNAKTISSPDAEALASGLAQKVATFCDTCCRYDYGQPACAPGKILSLERGIKIVFEMPLYGVGML
jgi:hypothetical protein